MRRGIIAIVACAALLYGCATPWPAVMGRTSPALARHAQPIGRIDVLPIDLQLWVDGPSRGSPEALRLAAESELVGATSAALYQRGYAVGAVIDWAGGFTGDGGARAVALDRPALLATMDALSTYGTAAARADGLPVPYLPARLGETTGADATLYIGGWSFVGDDESSASKIAEYTLIAVVIVAVVIIAIAASKHGGGGGLGAVGRVAEGAGKIVVSAGRLAARGVAEQAPRLLEAVARTADAFGRLDVGTHIELCDTRPDWHAHGPRDGNSAMYLEMTLVDNHTGLVLWHARQQFPASAAHTDQIDRVVASLVATLPPQP